MLTAATVAATLINLNRRPTDPPISPYDFVMPETDRDRAKKNIASLFGMIGTASPEQLQQMRERAIDGLKKEGFADAEEIFQEVFTSWKVTSNGANNSRHTSG